MPEPPSTLGRRLSALAAREGGVGHPAAPDIQADTYAVGSGEDYIDARRGGADEISCGTGEDEAVLDDKDTEVPRGGRCELLRGGPQI